jgi:molybdopterin-guanine dinucleotide biosynthesis protein B
MSAPAVGPRMPRPWPRVAGRALVAVVGWKNSGKTTLVERLIAEFTRQGLVVASVKHSHHAFAIDDGATDSARHRRAGARQVAVVSNARWALLSELGEAPEPSLEDILARMGPADIVVVEGYKGRDIPKIEARRRDGRPGPPLAAGDPWVVAVATDHATGDAETTAAGPVPVLDLDDIAGLAAFVLTGMGLDR